MRYPAPPRHNSQRGTQPATTAAVRACVSSAPPYAVLLACVSPGTPRPIQEMCRGRERIHRRERQGIGGVELRVWVNVDAIAFVEAQESDSPPTGSTLARPRGRVLHHPRVTTADSGRSSGNGVRIWRTGVNEFTDHGALRTYARLQDRPERHTCRNASFSSPSSSSLRWSRLWRAHPSDQIGRRERHPCCTAPLPFSSSWSPRSSCWSRARPTDQVGRRERHLCCTAPFPFSSSSSPCSSHWSRARPRDHSGRAHAATYSCDRAAPCPHPGCPCSNRTHRTSLVIARM